MDQGITRQQVYLQQTSQAGTLSFTTYEPLVETIFATSIWLEMVREFQQFMHTPVNPLIIISAKVTYYLYI
jgi:hypothetical protein